jgi:hypothetical protein
MRNDVAADRAFWFLADHTLRSRRARGSCAILRSTDAGTLDRPGAVRMDGQHEVGSPTVIARARAIA